MDLSVARVAQRHQVVGSMVIFALVNVVDVESCGSLWGSARSASLVVAIQDFPLQRRCKSRRVRNQRIAIFPQGVVFSHPRLGLRVALAIVGAIQSVRPRWDHLKQLVAPGARLRDAVGSCASLGAKYPLTPGCWGSPYVLTARFARYPFAILGLTLPSQRRVLTDSVAIGRRGPGQLRWLTNDLRSTMGATRNPSFAAVPLRDDVLASQCGQTFGTARNGRVLPGSARLHAPGFATDRTGYLSLSRLIRSIAFGSAERPGIVRHSACKSFKFCPAMCARNPHSTSPGQGDCTAHIPHFSMEAA
jgi:hypothetical protein